MTLLHCGCCRLTLGGGRLILRPGPDHAVIAVDRARDISVRQGLFDRRETVRRGEDGALTRAELATWPMSARPDGYYQSGTRIPVATY